MKGCVSRFAAWVWMLCLALVWQAGRAQTVAVPTGVAASAPLASSASSAGTTSSFRIRPVDDAWRAAVPSDARAANQAYLARLPADVVARSNAYYEGGYWLRLIDWLTGLGVAAVRNGVCGAAP